MKFKCKKTGKIVDFEPIMINAALVSAQNRKRLFWTNIPNVTQPEDRGILLKDILENGDCDRLKSYCIDASYYKGGSLEHYKEKGTRQIVFCATKRRKDSKILEDKGNTLTSSYRGSPDGDSRMGIVRIGQIGKGGQGDRIYSPEGKSVGLSALGGGRGAKTGLYAIAPNGKQIILGDEPLQVLKEGRTELGKKSRQEIREKTGKDSTFRSKGHKAYYGREGLKANCITTGLGAEGMVVQEKTAEAVSSSKFPHGNPDGNLTSNSISDNFTIRKLTPIECERLQSLPDNYTDGISNSQRYKCLGNAFNCAVVKHILSFISRP